MVLKGVSAKTVVTNWQSQTREKTRNG